jgi:hypothetical protein
MAAWTTFEHLINAALWVGGSPYALPLLERYMPRMVAIGVLAVGYSYATDYIGGMLKM